MEEGRVVALEGCAGSEAGRCPGSGTDAEAGDAPSAGPASLSRPWTSLVDRVPPQDDRPSPAMAFSGQPTDDICIGDHIALYSEDRSGFVFAYQSANVFNEVAVASKQDYRQPNVRCPAALVFELCAQNRYKAGKKSLKLQERLRQTPQDHRLRASYLQAKKVAEAEAADNLVEQRRQQGKAIVYGQVLQLRHHFTAKFLHVNTTQTAWTEASNLLTQLLPQNGKRAQFRVLPRYKVKSEGDFVQSEDLVILESVKSPGQYLHVSSLTFPDTNVYNDSFELNLSVIPSGFSLRRYRSRRLAEAGSGRISGGSLIRLFHKELEGYVAAEGVFGEAVEENVHIRIRNMNPEKHKTLRPPTSAIVVWVLEKAGAVLDGDEGSWDEAFHLLHLTTRQYLQLGPGAGGLAASLTPDRNSPATIFRFQPLNKTPSGPIEDKTHCRIQHVVSGAWLHGDPKLRYERQRSSRGGRRSEGSRLVWSSAPLRRLGGAAEMKYDDAYTLQLLPKAQAADMDFVAGTLPFLHKLLIEFRIGEAFSPRRMQRVVAALEELKAFVKPLGKVTKDRQKLLRDFKVLDILIDLLRCQAEDTRFRDFVLRVHSLSFEILKVYLEGRSAKNELYLAVHIEFFQAAALQQTEVGRKAAFMLMELLRDNRRMIELVSQEQVLKFIRLLAKAKFHRYLELLSVLCIENGICLPDNQSFIARQWLQAFPRQGHNVLYTLAVGQEIGLQQDVIFVSMDKRRSWLPLLHFLDKKNGVSEQDIMFLEYQLRLFASLCRGRNAEAIAIVSEDHYSWGLAFKMLQDPALADKLRTVVAETVQHLFIDVGDSVSQMERVRLVFQYSEVGKNGGRLTTLPDAGAQSQMSYNFIPTHVTKSLKDWIKNFFAENSVMVASAVERNRLIERVLRLVGALVNFGYYGDTSDISHILKPIIRLMDGKSDRPWPPNPKSTAKDLRQEAEQFTQNTRFLVNAENDAIADAKYAAMQVIDLFLNFRFNTRLNKFIMEFKEAEAKPREEMAQFFLSPMPGSEEEEKMRSSPAIQRVAQKLLHEAFADTDILGPEFLAILKDLLSYRYEKLVTQSLVIIKRLYSAHDNVFKLSVFTQLLTTESSISAYRKVRSLTNRLRLAKKSKWTEALCQEVVEDMRALSRLCTLGGSLDDTADPHPNNQELLISSGLVGDFCFAFFAFFQRREGALASQSWSADEVQILAACLSFLRLLTRGQKGVQERLFGRLDFLLSLWPCDEQLGELLVEVFRNHKPNCLKVSAAQIKRMVQRYTETMEPVWPSVLASLVVSDSLPIKRNQNLVVKALMTYQKSLGVFTSGEGGRKMRALSLSLGGEGREVGSEGRQLCGTVLLFGACSMGENEANASLCQCLLTMEDLLGFLALPDAVLCPGLRLPFVQFLNFGYLHSFSETAKGEMAAHAADPRFHAFLRGLADTIQAGTDVLRREGDSAWELLRYRSPHLHRSVGDQRHEARETLLLVLEGVAPLLLTFFERHWRSSVAFSDTDAHLLLRALHGFAQAAAPAITRVGQRARLLRTLQLMGYTTGSAVDIPAELFGRADTPSPAQLKYEDDYDQELFLNKSFDAFANNMRLAYGGKNTLRAQIGFPSDEEYTAIGSEDELPLGREFQDMVRFFAASDKGRKKGDVYDILGILKHLSWSRRMAEGKLEREKRELDELDIHCLRLLRAMIHNELVKVPPKAEAPAAHVRLMAVVRSAQNSLDSQGLIKALLPNLRRKNRLMVREAFNLLNVLYKGNSETPASFVEHVEREHDEAFFVAVRDRLTAAAALIKEQRFAAALLQRSSAKSSSLAKAQKRRGSAHSSRRSAHSPKGQGQGLMGSLLKRTKDGLDSVAEGSIVGLIVGRDESDNPDLLKHVPEVEPNQEDEAALATAGSEDLPLIRLDGTGSAGSSKKSGSAQFGLLVEATMSVKRTLGKADVPQEEATAEEEEAAVQMDLSAYRDLTDVKVVMNTLQSLCDLEYHQAQNLMREQPDNVKSVNIISELGHLLSLVYTDTSGDRIDLVSSIVETMVEFVQGNPGNQTVVFDAKLIDHINHMLRVEDFPECETEQISRLHEALATVIRFMTEENHRGDLNAQLSKAFLTALNEEGLWTAALSSFRRWQKEGDKVLKEASLETAFTFYFVLRRSMDVGVTPLHEYHPPHVWKFFADRARSIEFIKGGCLQKLYFRSTDEKALRDEVAEKLKWEVDRTSYGNKMRDFINWTRDIHQDMRAQRKIHASLLGLFFVRQWKAFNYTVLLCTLVLNVMMLVTWEETVHRENPTQDILIYHSSHMDVMWRVAGALHNVASFCLVLSYFLSNAAGIASSWRRWLGRVKWHTRRLRPGKASQSDERLALQRPSRLEVSFLGPQVVYYSLYLVLSVAGTLVTPAFFAFHLFQIVHNNQLLARVIRAVTLNGRSLLYVAILGMVIIYIFGLIAFLFLRDVYQGNLHFCESLYQCTLSTVREGLLYRLTRIDYPVKRTWGLNAAGEPWAINDNLSFQIYGLKLVWDLAYWVLVITVGLNLVFGIIVDTFRQLRDAKWRIEQDIEQRCFICARNSYEFESRGISFRFHCAAEHCVLHYVFFFARLADLPKESLSHLEMHLRASVDKDDFSFFPLDRALSLEKEDEAASETAMEMTIIGLLQEVKGMLKEERDSRQRGRRLEQQRQWVQGLASPKPQSTKSSELFTREARLPPVALAKPPLRHKESTRSQRPHRRSETESHSLPGSLQGSRTASRDKDDDSESAGSGKSRTSFKPRKTSKRE